MATRARQQPRQKEDNRSHTQEPTAHAQPPDATRLLAELKRIDGISDSAGLAALEKKAQAARQAAKEAMPLSKQAGILERKISWKEGTKGNAAEKVAQAKAAVEKANEALQKANSDFEARSTELRELQAELAALRKREQESPCTAAPAVPSDALAVLTAALSSMSASSAIMFAMDTIRQPAEAASTRAALPQEEQVFDEMQIDQILAESEVAEAFEHAMSHGSSGSGGADSAGVAAGVDGDAGAADRRTEVQAKRRRAINMVAQTIAKARRQCG